MSSRQLVDVVDPITGYTRLAKEYKDWHQHLDSFDKGAWKRLLPRELRGLHLLDIGSGDGRIFKYFRDTPIGSYTACDAVAPLLERHPNGQNVHKVVCDANENLPFPDGSFDVILCFFVVEYLNDLDHVCREIERLLAPSGTVLIGNFLQRREMTFVHDKRYYKVERTSRRKEDILTAMEGNFLSPVAHDMYEKTSLVGRVFAGKKT